MLASGIRQPFNNTMAIHLGNVHGDGRFTAKTKRPDFVGVAIVQDPLVAITIDRHRFALNEIVQRHRFTNPREIGLAWLNR